MVLAARLRVGAGARDPKPGTRGMGAGWEVSLSASLHLPLLSFKPPQPRPGGQTVGRWAPLLCGVSVWTSGLGRVNLHKDPLRLGC